MVNKESTDMIFDVVWVLISLLFLAVVAMDHNFKGSHNPPVTDKLNLEPKVKTLCSWKFLISINNSKFFMGFVVIKKDWIL